MRPQPHDQGAGTTPAPATPRPSIIQRHPATAFVALAFALSWLVWIPTLLLSAAQWPVLLGAFGPAVAGAIMVRVHGGKVREWLRGMAVFRVRLRWYALALSLPLLETVVQTLLAFRAGAPLSLGAMPERAPMILTAFVTALLLGGGQEEPGWRGWLLPKLQARVNPLAASLLIGVVWALWHLPLYVIGPYQQLSFALYMPVVVAMAVVFTWLYNASSGSIVIAMLLHAQVNTAQMFLPVADLEQYESVLIDGGLVTALQLALAALYTVVAALVVARHGTGLARPTGLPRPTGEPAPGHDDHASAR